MTDLNDVAVLTEKVNEAKKKIQEAEVSKAVIKQKRAELDAKLNEVGIEDWSMLDAEIEKAEAATKAALDTLATALVAAGVTV